MSCPHARFCYADTDLPCAYPDCAESIQEDRIFVDDTTFHRQATAFEEGLVWCWVEDK